MLRIAQDGFLSEMALASTSLVAGIVMILLLPILYIFSPTGKSHHKDYPLWAAYKIVFLPAVTLVVGALSCYNFPIALAGIGFAGPSCLLCRSCLTRHPVSLIAGSSALIWPAVVLGVAAKAANKGVLAMLCEWAMHSFETVRRIYVLLIVL